MQTQFAFCASIAFGLTAWGIVVALYIWPELRFRLLRDGDADDHLGADVVASDTGRLGVVLLSEPLCIHDLWVYKRNLGEFFHNRDANQPEAAVAGERSIKLLQARLDTLQQTLEARLRPAPKT